MKIESLTTLIILSALFLFQSCAYYGTDKNGKPTGVMVGTRGTGIKHNDSGFYAETIDTQTGLKDTMDFAGLATSAYFSADVIKSLSADTTGVTNRETKAGVDSIKAKEGTKQLKIREATKQKAIAVEALTQ